MRVTLLCFFTAFFISCQAHVSKSILFVLDPYLNQKPWFLTRSDRISQPLGSIFFTISKKDGWKPFKLVVPEASQSNMNAMIGQQIQAHPVSFVFVSAYFPISLVQTIAKQHPKTHFVTYALQTSSPPLDISSLPANLSVIMINEKPAFSALGQWVVAQRQKNPQIPILGFFDTSSDSKKQNYMAFTQSLFQHLSKEQMPILTTIPDSLNVQIASLTAQYANLNSCIILAFAPSSNNIYLLSALTKQQKFGTSNWYGTSYKKSQALCSLEVDYIKLLTTLLNQHALMYHKLNFPKNLSASFFVYSS